MSCCSIWNRPECASDLREVSFSIGEMASAEASRQRFGIRCRIWLALEKRLRTKEPGCRKKIEPLQCRSCKPDRASEEH